MNSVCFPAYQLRRLSPAKINLFLNISGERTDSYHDIYSLICSVSLFDSVLLSFLSEKRVVIICDSVVIPWNKDNLVYKAIQFFLNKLFGIGIYLPFGIKVVIWKKIPIGSGFGGGSSNAAVVLLLLNECLDFPFDKENLINIGKSVGADVPFFLFGGFAFASGIGDKLELFFGKLPRFAVLVYTGLLIETRWSYEKLEVDYDFGLTKLEKIIKSVKNVGCSLLCKSSLFNDLELVIGEQFPILIDIKKLLIDLGAVSCNMSGSGSGVFGLFWNFDQAIFSANVLLSLRFGWFVRVVRLLD